MTQSTDATYQAGYLTGRAVTATSNVKPAWLAFISVVIFTFIGAALGVWLTWNFDYIDFSRHFGYGILIGATGLLIVGAMLWFVWSQYKTLGNQIAPFQPFRLGVVCVNAFSWVSLIALTACLMVTTLAFTFYSLSLFVIGLGVIAMSATFCFNTLYGFAIHGPLVRRDAWSWLSLLATVLCAAVLVHGFSQDHKFATGFISSQLFLGEGRTNKQLQASDIPEELQAEQAHEKIAQIRTQIARQADLSVQNAPEVLRQVGGAIEQLKQLPSAFEVERQPDQAQKLRDQAIVLLDRNQRINFAKELLQRAFTLDPLDPELLRRLGDAEWKTALPINALQRFLLVLRLEPTKPENWLGYAKSLAVQAKTKEALSIDQSVQANLAGYWFSADRNKAINKLTELAQASEKGLQARATLAAILSLNRIAHYDKGSTLGSQTQPLPNSRAFESFSTKFLAQAKEDMAAQSWLSAKAFAEYTLVTEPNNETSKSKQAQSIIQEVDRILSGQPSKPPTIWGRIWNWFKSLVGKS